MKTYKVIDLDNEYDELADSYDVGGAHYTGKTVQLPETDLTIPQIVQKLVDEGFFDPIALNHKIFVHEWEIRSDSKTITLCSERVWLYQLEPTENE